MNVSDTFWTRKYRRHIAAMIGVCYRYVPDRETAEDLAHDAFLRAMEKADTLRFAESFDRWLTRITVNTVVTHLRESTRVDIDRQERDLEELPDTDGDIPPETMLEAIRQADFTREEILEAITQLPEHHRTVLNLYVFEGLSHKQIADLLGILANTSKSHLMRARKELQIILFNKSKRKNRPLMTIILPLFGVDAAFDRYCRRQIGDFALPPQRPITVSGLHGTATAKLPLRTRFHALRAPLAAGIGVAAVGAMLIPAVHPKLQPPAPAPVQPTPSAVTTALPSADSTATTVMPQSSTKTTDIQSVKKVSTPETQAIQETQGTQEAQETAASPNDPPDTAAVTPVVVKKVVRHSNRTVVIGNRH